MRIYGLIGYPLSHSFSKKFFAEKFFKEDVTDCVYENFAIPSIEEFESLVHTAFLKGLNVTIPYKQRVIPYLHEVNEVVKKTGACNCIKIENGKLFGFNTDTIGFEQSLKKFLKPYHTRALILGTGGAAKAIMYVLEKLEIKYITVTRKNNGLVYPLMSYSELTDELIRSHTLIINTTPLGMYPDINVAPPINYEMITPSHYLFDVVYNPEKTLFLKQGEDKGASIQNGFDMLIIQAEESWKIWNNEV
ncbi:MAG: shikimate dehydrogenase [Chitinophagaceae bacterium]